MKLLEVEYERMFANIKRIFLLTLSLNILQEIDIYLLS